jgi:hypothetical protein
VQRAPSTGKTDHRHACGLMRDLDLTHFCSAWGLMIHNGDADVRAALKRPGQDGGRGRHHLRERASDSITKGSRTFGFDSSTNKSSVDGDDDLNGTVLIAPAECGSRVRAPNFHQNRLS